MIKVFLIDDEKMALEHLKYILNQYEMLDIQGVFTDPVEALEKIKTLKPDIIFLDIEMPGINGLITAKKISTISEKISIVFVTAYDQYVPTVKFYDVNAIDVILKPVSKKRINQVMEKLITKVNRNGE